MFHISVELPELGVGEKGMHLHYLQCSSGGYEIQHYKNVLLSGDTLWYTLMLAHATSLVYQLMIEGYGDFISLLFVFILNYCNLSCLH